MYDNLIYTKNLTVHCFLSPRLWTRPPPLLPQHEFPLILCNNHLRLNEMNGSFRPPLYTYRLNWARETSWQWWDEWNDAALQTQDSKFEPWRSEAEHDTTRSRRLSTISKTDDTKKLRKWISSLANLLQSASQSWRSLELLLICDTYGARAFHIWRRARRLWRSRLIFVEGGGAGNSV